MSTSSIKSFLRQRYTLHIVFWLSYLVFFTFLYSYSYADGQIELKKHFINLLSGMPAFLFSAYLISYYIVPQFLLKRKVFGGILLMLASLSISSLADIYLSYLFLFKIAYNLDLANLHKVNFQLFLINLPWVSYPVVIFASIKFIKNHYQSKAEKESARRIAIEAEHRNMLRQLNPHFLFNNLNNLYQLTLIKSDKAPLMVAKMSELLRYTIQDSLNTNVDLQEEINFIESYIELQKLRYEDEISVCFKRNQHLPSLKIIPFSFFYLVENAFNNGILEQTEPSKLNIILKTSEQHIKLAISCGIDKNKSSTIINNLEKGLMDIKQHLQLLYKERFELKTHLIKGRFITFIELKNTSRHAQH